MVETVLEMGFLPPMVLSEKLPRVLLMNSTNLRNKGFSTTDDPLKERRAKFLAEVDRNGRGTPPWPLLPLSFLACVGGQAVLYIFYIHDIEDASLVRRLLR
jgi:hypothetical protein